MIRSRTVKYLAAVGLWAVLMVQPSIPGRAFEWWYLTFTEDGPVELKAAVRNLFAERISQAEKKYPAYPVQILIGRRSNGSIPSFAQTKIFYTVLAGNPDFCDDLGCTMVAIGGTEKGGWKPGKEYRTNGALIFTDTSEALIETRQGCVILSALRPIIFPGDVVPDGEPCADWARRERFRLVSEIRTRLANELYYEGIHFSDPSYIDSSFELELGETGAEPKLHQVIAELEKSHDFRWQKDGKTYHFIVERPEDGALYHEIKDSEIRWVTEVSLENSSPQP